MSEFLSIFRNNLDLIAKWPLLCIASLTVGVYAMDWARAFTDYMESLGVPAFLALMMLGAVLFIGLALVATVINWWDRRNRRTVLVIAPGRPASKDGE